MEGNDKGMSL